MRKLLLFCALLVLLASGAYAQSHPVNGTVTDSTTAPLAGVTVALVGTKIAAVTDNKGKFTIDAATGQTLQFSYIGYQPNSYLVPPTTGDVKIILQENATDLNEVVVTGYTTEKKKDLTGAVSVVNVNDIKNIPDGNAMKALQGRVPGLSVTADGSPNGSVSVLVRGITTLNSNLPLYVIDGIPTQRGLQEINQDDIASIQVLRDAASASIYGSRAAAGVIIITTKKGKKGTQHIDLDASTSYQYFANRPKVLNTTQDATAYWQAQVNDDRFGPNASSPVDPSVSSGIYTYNWNKNYNDPVLYGVNIPAYIDAAHTEKAANTDWYKAITQSSILQNYTLTVSNGSDKSHSLFSIGYYNDKGIVKYSGDTKYNLRYNSDYSLFGGRLVIGETLSATYMKDPEVPAIPSLQVALGTPPVIPVHTADGVGWGGPVGGMNTIINPLMSLYLARQNENAFGRVFGNTYADVAILPNLHFKSTFAADLAGNYYHWINPPFQEGFFSVLNDFGGQSTDYEVTETWQNQLTYDLSIKKHRINVLLGEENIKDKYQNFNAQGQGYALDNIDYAYLSEATKNITIAGAGSGDALLSYFGKVNYVYDDKYLAAVTLRRDGSSRFGANNRYAYFPAASVGWRLSQEDFVKKNLPFFSDLKIRFSWGQTGNQNGISQYGTSSLYASVISAQPIIGGVDGGTAYDLNGTGTGTLPSGYVATQTGNPNLKWETTTQSNLGIDFGLFNNTISGSIDGYYKNTTNILISPPYLGVLGEGGNEFFNGASMVDRGLEIQLNYSTTFTKDLSMVLNGNISGYRNKVTYLPNDVLSGYPGNGTTQTILGRSINSFYGYVTQGLFTSASELQNSATQPGKALGRIRYADLDGNGVIDANDQAFIGSTDPKFAYGFNATFNYRRWSLMIYLQGVQGGLEYNNYKSLTDFTSLVAGSNYGTRVLNAWTPENPTSTIPALTLTNTNNEGRMSTYFLEPSTYLKLRNVQLSYDLKDLFRKIKVQRATIYLAANNLLLMKSSKYTGPDPENTGNAYPTPAITSIGLNLSF